MNKYLHKPYSRAEGKDYSKQEKGFRDVPVHAGHPLRVFTARKERTMEGDPVFFMRQRIKSLKQGMNRQYRNAAGRGLSVEGGIKDLKKQLRALRDGKQRK